MQDGRARQLTVVCTMFVPISFIRSVVDIFRRSILPLRQNVAGFAANSSKESTVKLDARTMDLISRLSLVDFVDETQVANLESAIEFANQLLDVEVADDVEPMYSVQEDGILILRDDKVTVADCRDQLIAVAQKSEEEYFVTPTGNVPLSSNN